MKSKILSLKAQWLSLIVLGILPLLLGCTSLGGAAHSTEWKDPPRIEMQDCIRIASAIGPNPFSDDPNDLALMTTYEEKDLQTADKKALLMVNGIFLDQARHLPIVYLSAVVVNITHRKHDITKISYWILADTKADGRLDRVLYREKAVTNSGEELIVSQVEGNKEEIASLQNYYEHAVRSISAKAKSEPPDSCATGDEEI